MIDASEHIGILHHVVQSATMSIPYHMRDEALSEGLVLLTQAAKSYDPKRGVPAHFWLAKKLRWGLQNWKLRESHAAPDGALSWQEGVDEEPKYDPVGLHEARLELETLVELAKDTLTDKEYLTLFGPAFGLHMKELSHLLGANPTQIKAIRTRARDRIMINEIKLI